MKALDLSNQKFGKLTVIEKAPKRNDKHTRWICQCDCGNISEVRTDYLRNGHTTSCGCEKQKIFSSPQNILQLKFGKLTPIKYDEFHSSYLCKCDCGNEVYVLGYNLTNGNTQSCGCLKSKGELKLNELLNSLNISYKTQYSFEECRFPDTNRLAYFDYAIFYNNQLVGLIEYDGSQHYYGWSQNKQSLQKIQAHDKFKEYFCLINNIPLIRIPYYDYDKLNKDYINNLLTNNKIPF